MLRGHFRLYRSWIALPCVVLVLAASSAGGATDPLEHCGAKKLGAIASACERVEITELNVHTWGFEGDQAAKLETQRRFYRDVVAACLAVDACRATTLWLFTDRYPTTIEQALGQDAMPLVFDGDYRRKPAYFGVRAGLLAVPRP